jgi:hypothetical protein
MASSSLVVRISADINDFAKQLRQMTREVDEAAKKVSEVGKALSLSLTLPLVAAGAAMAKLGMEQQAAASKLDRQFGASAEGVRKEIEKMRQAVPATTTELMKMANQMNQFGQGVGMAAPQAALFSGEILKMAATLQAANPGTSMDQATDALMRGLSGSGKALLEFGVKLNETQVKQEAYHLGLLKIGQDLTPLGTALATYAILTERVGKMQQETGAVQNDAARQWAFLKTNVVELAESVGVKLLPAFVTLVQAGKDLIDWLSQLSDGTIKSALYVAVFAAAIGPTISLVAELTAGTMKLYEAMKLLASGEALEKIVAIFANPEVLVGIAVLTAALYGLSKAWEHFHTEATAIKPKIDLGPLANIQALIAAANGKSGATSFNPENPLQQFQKQAGQITSAYDDAIKMGAMLVQPFDAVVALNERALALYGQQADKLGEMAQAARKVAIETKALIDAKNAAAALFNGFGSVGAARSAVGSGALNPTQVTLAAGAQAISDENQLRMREAALRAKDTFDALRVATVNLGERFKQTAHDFATGMAEFKKQWSSVSGIKDSATAGLQAGVASILSAMNPMALVFEAVGKVMQGFQPLIDNLMGPLVAFGQILAEIAGPVLRPVFQALKVFGIATAVVGEVIFTVAGGIAKAIGGLISAIGAFIRKIPFLGGIGKDIQNFGNNISNLGTSALNTAKQLDRSRIDLQNLDFDSAASGLSNLSNAANAAAEAMTFVPQAFKIQLERYYATAPIDNTYVAPPSSPGGSYGSPGGDASGGSGRAPTADANAVIMMDGKVVGQMVWNRVRSSAKRQFGDAARIADVAVVH